MSKQKLVFESWGKGTEAGLISRIWLRIQGHDKGNRFTKPD